MEERIQYLLAGWMQGGLTEAENSAFYQLLVDDDQNELFKEALDAVWFSKEFNDKMGEDSAAKIFREITGAKVVPMRKTWTKWVAAAVIVFVVCGLWFVVSQESNLRRETPVIAKTHDVPAPNSSRAMITLADGTKVYLDSVGNGTVAQQGNTNVIKTEDGRIIYSHEDTKAQSEIAYNTLSNPRGSKVIDMQLSDGSHVWLNAGSSVKYPVAFVGNERKVEITGEAYFEVAHVESPALKGTPFNKGGRANALPFIVQHGDVSVTVLGTHFNVNAYDDEEVLRVTLLEGSVKVSANNKSVFIKPDEQAVVNTTSHSLLTNSSVDIDEVMAWKNGRFVFNSADIQSIMRQISRWYDVDVVYEGQITEREFTGKINRNVNASEVMAMLEYAGVHFKIEGRKIVVMP
jgi:ferric-dicitrate binding protein FerR (iron transport regulator)